MSQDLLILVCPQCGIKNKVDKTRIHQAKCGECKTLLKPVEAVSHDKKCKKCGEEVSIKYRYSEKPHYEKIYLEHCDNCFIQLEFEKLKEKRIKELWKPSSLLSTIFSILLFTVIGGLLSASIILDFSEDINLSFISAATVPSLIIFILAIMSATKSFRKNDIEQVARQQATNNLNSINYEHKEILNLILKQEKKREYDEKVKRSGIKVIDTMNGAEFEDRLYHLFCNLGYKVSKTPASGDQGADLIISKGNKSAVVQAKCYSRQRKVTNKAVQEAIAGKYYYKTSGCWVVTNTYFTEPAKKLAKEANVTLVDRQKLINLLDKAQAQQI